MDTQPDRPITARAALLAFADELDDILDPAAIPQVVIDTIVHMARERAQHLPDEPYGVELVGTPALDVDQQIRVEALRAAVQRWTWAITPDAPDTAVLATARTFEAYLRGDR